MPIDGARTLVYSDLVNAAATPTYSKLILTTVAHVASWSQWGRNDIGVWAGQPGGFRGLNAAIKAGLVECTCPDSSSLAMVARGVTNARYNLTSAGLSVALEIS